MGKTTGTLLKVVSSGNAFLSHRWGWGGPKKKPILVGRVEKKRGTNQKIHEKAVEQASRSSGKGKKPPKAKTKTEVAAEMTKNWKKKRGCGKTRKRFQRRKGGRAKKKKEQTPPQPLKKPKNLQQEPGPKKTKEKPTIPRTKRRRNTAPSAKKTKK